MKLVNVDRHTSVKGHLSRLPDSVVYPQYNDRNPELALVYMLYEGADGDGIIHFYPKSAIHSARSFVFNSDVVRRKIPIYFMIEDAIWREWSVKFEEWGVLSERLIEFSVPFAPGIKHRRFGKSLYVLESDLLCKYDYVASIDCDLFVCCDDKIETYLSTYHLQSDNVSTFNFTGGVCNWWEKENWWDKWGRESTDVMQNYLDSIGGIQEVMPSLKLDCRSSFWAIEGAVMGFSRRMPAEFKEFALKIEPYVGDDELVLALWMSYSGLRVEGLPLFPLLFDARSFWEWRKGGVYYSHFWCAGKRFENWEKAWQSDIGVGREL